MPYVNRERDWSYKKLVISTLTSHSQHCFNIKISTSFQRHVWAKKRQNGSLFKILYYQPQEVIDMLGTNSTMGSNENYP